MSKIKQEFRAAFRKAVFTRDRFRCRGCGFQSSFAKANEELDAHHIINRNDIPHGGYVKENGISLCKTGENCHLKAEQIQPGFEEARLFVLIGSSRAEAIAKAGALK